MVGTILTQNTAWTNVEKALLNLKHEECLTVDALCDVSMSRLKTLIRPSGYFNQKAPRLKTLACHIKKQYGGSLDTLFSKETHVVREELLCLSGVGPETADSMLLYAGDHPVFVVDAYTKRLNRRLPFPIPDESYDAVQKFYQSQLQKTVPQQELVHVYNELHALIVHLAKHVCTKTKPECTHCPVQGSCDKVFS